MSYFVVDARDGGCPFWCGAGNKKNYFIENKSIDFSICTVKSEGKSSIPRQEVKKSEIIRNEK